MKQKCFFATGHSELILVCFISILVLPFIGCGDDDKAPTSSGPPSVTGLEQVTSGTDYDPTISPDGQWLAFRRSGTGVVKYSLTNNTSSTLCDFGYEPDWSRTDDLILIRGAGLFTVDASDGDTAFICDNSGWDDGAVWSPSGDEIAAEGSSGLVVISYPGGVLSPVECYDPDGSGCQGEGPTWSPDGEWIAFEDGLEILKVARSGDTAETVVADLNDVGSPAWSPDGNWIAFVMEDSSYTGYYIWVADYRGTDYGLTQVTFEDTTLLISCYDGDPCWSPDSKTIYFSSNRVGNGGIWRIGFEP